MIQFTIQIPFLHPNRIRQLKTSDLWIDIDEQNELEGDEEAEVKLMSRFWSDLLSCASFALVQCAWGWYDGCVHSRMQKSAVINFVEMTLFTLTLWLNRSYTSLFVLWITMVTTKFVIDHKQLHYSHFMMTLFCLYI